MGDLSITREDSIEIIKLNRPDKKNALTYEMALELGTVFEELQFNDEVRAVLLTGEGGAFCAGADLSGKGGRADVSSAVGMRLTTKAYARIVQGIWSLEKPVIAAVNGIAAGGGCNLALVCDIIVASTEARFVQIFAKRGLIADVGGTFFVPRAIGLAKAKELMFSGREVGAQEALELGLVNKVVPADSLMDEAMAITAEYAKGATRAIGMMKRMLNSSFESDILTALDREASLQGIAISTSDSIEGVMSFMQKRDPNFHGK